MTRIWLTLAALDGFMAVAAGAFGAHGVGDPKAKALLQTGAQYQAAHAVAALACAAVAVRLGAASGWAGWLFSVGALVFGGSLYVLALSGVRVWGAVTPLGGLLLLAGWAALAVGAATSKP